MKKCIIMLLGLLLCLTTGALAEAAIEIDGVIEPAESVSIRAPYSGMAGDFDWTAGDQPAQGEALLALSTQKIYAEFDGTVTGVFALPGDDAASVQERYGALMYMERGELYTAACSTNGAAGDNENKIVHAGETVYVQSTADNKRDGVGVVTNVAGRDYTVVIRLIDELRVNDQIKVYREEDHDGDSCIGSGKISRIDPVPVTAQGHVLAVHVTGGQTVSRGTLLMETVPDALDGRMGGDGVVRMPQDGVLLGVYVQPGDQVAKEQRLASYCPQGAVKLVCRVDEDDLSQIALGDEMTVEFDAMEGVGYDAVITRIAAVADENGAYAVTLALEKTDGVRIGMSATAHK